MSFAAQLLLIGVVATPMARTAVCVDVAASESELAGLRSLVSSEVDRRPTHRAASEGEPCRSRLHVELVDVGGERYVTGRVGAHIPHRERVDEHSSLAGVVERVVTVVLHNDPVRLDGPPSNALSGWVRSLRRRGHNLYGFEAFQVVGSVQGQTFSLPGMALRLRREAGAAHIGARLAYATRLSTPAGPVTDRVDLLDWMSMTLEAAWFPLRSADISPYLVAEAGLAIQRFGGPPTAIAPVGEGYEVVREELLTLGARAGVEVLRTTDMRADLFTAAHLPVMPARDDLGVVRGWLPSVSLGAGVAF